MAETPPPYSATPNGATQTPAMSQYTSPPGTVHNRGASDSYLATQPSANNTPRQPSHNISSSKASFPKSFGIYHAPGPHSNMQIALSADAPPLFYISTHTGFSSQPSVVLHSGVRESSSVMATADFHSFSSSVDIKLFNQPRKLEREGPFSTVTSFIYPIPQTSGRMQGQTRLERFEWKSSSGPEVQSLQGSSHGMKCVRARTGEVVAAWARPNYGLHKKGKMRFLLNQDGLGAEKDKFETMVVISILAIMEKARRHNNSRSGGGARMAGAGFSGGGGGGC